MIAFAEPISDASHIAESLTGRSYLSWSAISTYLKCPLKYQFHDIDQLPEEFVSANLVFGAAIHAALEAFFGEHLASRRSLNVEALLAVYHSTWSQADLAAVRFGKSEDLASLGLLADRMLQAFVASDLSRPAGSIVGHRHEIGEQLLEQIDRLFDERCVDHNGESQAMSDLACPVDHLHLFVQELLGRNQPAMSLTSSPLRSVRLGRARYTGPPPSLERIRTQKEGLGLPRWQQGKAGDRAVSKQRKTRLASFLAMEKAEAGEIVSRMNLVFLQLFVGYENCGRNQRKIGVLRGNDLDDGDIFSRMLRPGRSALFSDHELQGFLGVSALGLFAAEQNRRLVTRSVFENVGCRDEDVPRIFSVGKHEPRGG